jgi:hypothetical protein
MPIFDPISTGGKTATHTPSPNLEMEFGGKQSI